jgi:nucleotide-binding universal stress UspA family protein
MTRSLIVGMDDTDDSRNALARAAELARAAGLRLVVVPARHCPRARFHGSVLIVRGGDSAWNPASASGPVLRTAALQPVSSAN